MPQLLLQRTDRALSETRCIFILIGHRAAQDRQQCRALCPRPPCLSHVPAHKPLHAPPVRLPTAVRSSMTPAGSLRQSRSSRSRRGAMAMTLTCSCLACSRHQAQQGNCTACSRCCPITNCWASRWSRCAGGGGCLFLLPECLPACLHACKVWCWRLCLCLCAAAGSACLSDREVRPPTRVPMPACPPVPAVVCWKPG